MPSFVVVVVAVSLFFFFNFFFCLSEILCLQERASHYSWYCPQVSYFRAQQ